MKTTLYPSLIEAIHSYYDQIVLIESRQPVSGGDINQAFRLSLSNGENLFVKMNHQKKIEMFEKEIHGLKVLESTNTLKVPSVIGIGLEGNHSFLLMEYIEQGFESNQYWKDLGKGLACMHQADTHSILGNQFGFLEDNYIGTNVQINTPMDSWVQFFIECRLIPQIQIAKNTCPSSTIQKLENTLPLIEKILVEPKQPSILHGDLWSGNVYCCKQGQPYVIDPAVYIGHREAEIAYTQLFGGFPDVFYQAYCDQYPLEQGYSQRKDVYNLYHLLNHYNLFGGSYLYSALAIIENM